jgi:hypothetical protein
MDYEVNKDSCFSGKTSVPRFNLMLDKVKTTKTWKIESPITPSYDPEIVNKGFNLITRKYIKV